MADIDNSLRLWSATAGSNKPTDATTIGSGLDDNLRQIQAVVRQFLASYGTAIASAATMDLSTMDGYAASVTGNTTVTGLGTEAAGISYWLIPASTPMFKNGASLIMPGGADYTCAAGDVLRFTSEGAGAWRCTQLLPNVGITGSGSVVRTTSPSIASPTLTGTPVAPTATAGTSTTQIATTAFVQTVLGPTVQVFTSTSGWVKPANLKSIIVEVVGGGGDGGTAASSGGNASAGGGGGAGGYTRKFILAASLAASVTATVGAAGALSAFQNHCTATGGSAGSNGGADTVGAGGAPGAGVNGDINLSGGYGSVGAISTVTSSGGLGGASFLGGGGAGTNNAVGTAAAAKGAGGGGAGDTTGGAARAGGAGAGGIIIVTEFY